MLGSAAMGKRARKAVNLGKSLSEFLEELRTIVTLSKKSKDIMKEIEKIDVEKAQKIYEIHQRISSEENFAGVEKEFIRSAFDRYLRNLEQTTPNHGAREIQKFGRFLDVYKQVRNDPWARFALRRAAERLKQPEHIDRVIAVARDIQRLEDPEHRQIAWLALHRASREDPFPENLGKIREIMGDKDLLRTYVVKGWSHVERTRSIREEKIR